MQLFEANWWRGFSRLLVLEQVPQGWNVLIVCKRKGEVVGENAKAGLSTDEMKQYLAEYQSLPVVLCFRGDFVFERIVNAQSQGNLVGAILGVNVENAREFPVMTFPAAGGSVFAAVIRKSKVDEYVAQSGIDASRIVDVVFSEAVLALPLQLFPSFEGKKITLKTATRIYSFSGQVFQESAGFGGEEKTEADVARLMNVGDAFAFSVAAGLYSLLRQAKEEIPHAEIQASRREHGIISLLKNIAAVSAAALVIVALSLVGLRTWSESQKTSMQRWVQQNQPLADSVTRARLHFEARQNLRNQLGGKTLRASKTSFYGDRIAALADAGISFQSIIMGPEAEDLKKAGLKESGGASFDMVVTGWSPNPKPISSLSVSLEAQDWVEEVKVIRSDLNYRNGNYDFVFVIRFKHAG